MGTERLCAHRNLAGPENLQTARACRTRASARDKAVSEGRVLHQLFPIAMVTGLYLESSEYHEPCDARRAAWADTVLMILKSLTYKKQCCLASCL